MAQVRSNIKIDNKKVPTIHTAISGNDFNMLLGEEVTFMVGDADGQERCADIDLVEDELVECDEDFTVSLALVTSKPNLSLGTVITTVAIYWCQDESHLRP